MRSGLGYCVVWYMVMNVLYECSVSVLTGSRKMKTLCAEGNLGTHQSDYKEDYNVES
jgi:hypothetical protein